VRGPRLQRPAREYDGGLAEPRVEELSMSLASFVGRIALKPFARALPPMGDTERAALEAGTVGFEGQLFAGRPDFDALRNVGPNRLTAEEQAFLDN